MKPRRAPWVLFLAFLLLSLQLEARVHPLGHLGERLRAVADHGTVASGVALHCAQCDLLAGGGDAPASAFEAVALPVETAAMPAARFATSEAGSFLPYRSRAPPSLR